MAKGNTSSTDDNSADNDSLSATPSTGGVRGIARSASRSKPYDANNSFVKKLGTKVSDLQRSWIGKFGWFNNSQEERDIQSENTEVQVDDKSQPPPSKRPCIRMDITHPPGTFDIKPRNRQLSNEAESSKEQFSNHNETTQDFLEPIASGSNFKPRFVASTPAFPVNSNNKVPYSRSALNMLMSERNNVATNGTDDNSESGESTSGCSSLIPQNNRQDGQSTTNFNLPFTQKKRFTDDKMSFTNHLQSPRSLFLDSTTRETLSSRQPSFNPAIVTQSSSLERSASLLSPFYPGNTMFGGANAANMFRKSKSLLANTSQVLNHTAPNRASVEVNPSSNNTSSTDVSNMSITARRILETLEQFSSPLSDAKKIPLRNVMGASTSSSISMSSTLGGSRKRTREDECDTPKVGLRHLARELSVPTVPDIMRIRRKQRLQNTTLNARKIMTARNAANAPGLQEYSLRMEVDNDSKRRNSQFKATKSSNLEEEDTSEPVNLPSLPLPITNLPRFDLPKPVKTAFSSTTNSSSLPKLTNASDSFKFASPIRLDGEKNLESISNFTFSKPITPSKIISKLNVGESSDLSKKLNLSSSDPTDQVSSFVNFMVPEPSENSTFKPQQEKLKTSKVSSDWKSGSVMDFFKKEAEKKDQSNVWECNDCLIKNNGSVTHCVACKRAKPDEDDNSSDIEIIESPSSPDNKSNQLQKENCLIRSSAKLPESSPSLVGKSSTKISTQVEIHSPSDSKSSASSIFNVESKLSFEPSESNQSKAFAMSNSEPILLKNCLESSSKSSPLKSNVPKSSWQCPICMVHNVESANSCPCCNTAKPGSINVTPKHSVKSSNSPLTSTVTSGSGSGFGNMFKKPEGAWTCDMCMIQNKADDSKCLACETPKPGSKPAISSSSFTVPATSGFGDKFKKPEGSWTCDSCMLSNKTDDKKCVACENPKPGSGSNDSTKPKLQFNVDMPANASSFKFGIDKAEEDTSKKVAVELPKTNGFSFGNSSSTVSAGNFTFGVPNNMSETTTGFAFKPSESTTAAATFQFGVKAVDSKDDSSKSEAPKSEKNQINSGFLFGSPDKAEEEKKECAPAAATFVFGSQPASVAPSSKVTDNKETKQPTNNFVFGSPKPIFGQQPSKTEAENKSTEVTKILSPEAPKSLPVLSFGTPVVSSSSTTSTTNVSSSSTTSSLFTFGSQNPITTTSSSQPNKPTSVLSFGNSIESPSFSNQANQPTQNLFGTPKSSTVSSDKSLHFGNSLTDNKVTMNSSTFAGEPDNKIIAFGTNADNKLNSSTFSTSTFGPPTTSANAAPSPFGSLTNSAAPINFGAAVTASSTVPSSPFGTPASTAAPSPFGTGSNMFGSGTASTFGTSSTASVFGSATKSVETSAPTSGLFSFNQPSQSAASSTSFNFSGGTPVAGSNDQKGIFSFGASSSVQPGNGFGSGFGNTPSTTPNFSFNTPAKPAATTTGFGQAAVSGTTPMFNAPAAQPVGAPPAYPGTAANPASASSGFNFGNTSVPNNFSFGTTSTSGSSGFNFNASTLSNASTPVTFDPNATPTFNFTAGTGAPNVFNAPPSNTAMPARKIKKAVRRMPRN